MARCLTHSGYWKTITSSHEQSTDRRVHGCKIPGTRKVPTSIGNLQREQQVAIANPVAVPAMQFRNDSVSNFRVTP